MVTKWTTNECVLCVCRFGISFIYVINSIDSKLISVCLITDYSLIAYLHIFVYGCAEGTSISLECTKVTLLILNNFDFISPLFHSNSFLKYPLCSLINFALRKNLQKYFWILIWIWFIYLLLNVWYIFLLYLI